jgi:hypothetical protein
MGLLLAGIAGAAEGLNKVYANHAADDLRAENKQDDLDKEKRVEEANIRRENRGIVNDDNKRLADDAFAHDPARVQRGIDEKLAGQAAIDKYGDSRVDEDVKREGLLAKARHIEGRDTTDYQGRKDDHAEYLEKQASNARLSALKEQLRNAKTGEESDKIERLIHIETKGTTDEKGKFTRHAVLDENGLPTGEYDVFNTNTGESVRQTPSSAAVAGPKVKYKGKDAYILGPNGQPIRYPEGDR